MMNPFPTQASTRSLLPLIFALGLTSGATAASDADRLIGPAYASDDMSLETPPGLASGMGVYFWVPKDEWYFHATMERIPDAEAAGNGYVAFTSTHNEKCYHPVGVSFGQEASGEPFTIDMSADGGDSVRIEVENVASVALRVRITLKDADENMIDTKPDTDVETPWNGAYEFNVLAKATVRKAFAYKGGYYAEWKSASKCNLANPSGGVPCGIQNIDMTRIAGANITINSINPEVTGITDAELRIHAMSFGRMPSTAVSRSSPAPGVSLRSMHLGRVVFPAARRTFDANGRGTLP